MTSVRAGQPRLQSAVLSDAGIEREVNEDSAIAEYPYFMVADGMGGHDAGDEASQAATRAFAAAIPQGEIATVEQVGQALQAAREAVNRVAAERTRGAGTTLTGAVLVEHEGRPHWLVLNIGDSRVYVHRGTELQQVTLDHSLRDELIAGGASGLEDLPGRNVITRALGAADSSADSWLLPVEDGTRLLICSDGLTTEIDDEGLRAVLTMGGRPEAVVTELVARANEAGGHDNITAVVVDVESGGQPWHIAPRSGRFDNTADASEGEETLTATIPRRER